MSQRQRSATQPQSSPEKSAPSPTPPAARAPHDQPAVLTVLNVHAAGIDVHSDMHMVCVPADRVAAEGDNRTEGMPAHVRRFGANSCDLTSPSRPASPCSRRWEWI